VNDVESAVKAFILEEVAFADPGQGLSEDTPLLSGILDSLGLMQLVAFLEEAYDIQVEDADMTADHFRDVASIAELVRSKTSERVAG
jgi:acyl carrier protein